MIKSLLIAFFLSLPIVSSAQSDSLLYWKDFNPVSIQSLTKFGKEVDKLISESPDSLEKYGRVLVQLSTQIDFKKQVAKGNNHIGIAFMHRNLYEQAMLYYLKAMVIVETLDNKGSLAVLYVNISTIYDEMGNSNESLMYGHKALKIFKEMEHERFISMTQINLGATHFNLENFDSSLFYFEKVLPYRIAHQDTLGLSSLFLNFGQVYRNKKNYKKSLENLQKARNFTSPEVLTYTDILLALGGIYIKLNNDQNGLIYLDSAILSAKSTNQPKLEMDSYKELKDYYKIRGDFKKSLIYLEKEFELDQKIRGEEVQSQIEVLNLKYEDSKKIKQLRMLEEEKANQLIAHQKEKFLLEKQQAEDQFDFWLVVTISTAILLLAILMIYTLRLRVRNARMSEKELQIQLEQKNKELTSYALNFIQKNELLGELTDKIAELKKQSDSKSIRELNQMSGIINSSFRMDQDWENFKMMFEELHGDFFNRLKDNFPELGNAELRLCALLRLNMNLKESSKILGISADSVKTARYRLRKKLGLATEDNLVDFLIKFDASNQQLEIA